MHYFWRKREMQKKLESELCKLLLITLLNYEIKAVEQSVMDNYELACRDLFRAKRNQENLYT
jgi:hypothetical protein